MKIAHVMRRLSFDDWGGTEQVVWNLAKAQKAAGHDVRIFATTALWRGGDSATKNTKNTKKTLWPLCSLWQRNTPDTEIVDGLEILRFKPIYPWWPMPKSLVAELDRKGGNPFVPGLGKALCDWRPDVIHCHAMARIAELCLRIGERGTENGKRVKRVISLHGGGANIPDAEAKSLKAPTRGRLPWGKMIDYLLGWTRHVPEDFDGIVCVGEDEYEKYKARHPHVVYLPNGVDTRLFENEKCKMENGECKKGEAFILHSPFSILCVARIDRQKNQKMLVELLARHPEAMLRLVGPVTQPDYKSELESRAAELGVAGRLSFSGALKPDSPELMAEYRRADMFILPSRHEPFGITALEAWAAGLPVIASDIGGLGRLCAAHPGAAVTFAPDDIDALDAAYVRLARSPEFRQALAAAGREAARNYDWRCLSQKLIGLYEVI
jgi:glycosyltransferase involved in cell wall biosynthesis